MANSLTPEIIEAIENRVERIRADFKERQEKDREYAKAITARLSWAIGIALTLLAYFGIKGFDDLVDRAIQKANAKEKWEAVLQNVRDHALVQSLIMDRASTSTSYNPFEIEAFQRLLQNPETSNQTFADVITLARNPKRMTDSTPVLDALTKMMKSNDKLDWRKQEALILYLGEHRHSSASDVILPLFNSSKQEVQLAVIKYVRDCEIVEATKSLSRLITGSPKNTNVQLAAAIALLSLDGDNVAAGKWVSGLKSQATRSLDDAADVLGQLAVITDVISRRISSLPSVSRATQPGTNDPAITAVVDIIRAVLLTNYTLTMARDTDTDRRLVYVAQDDNHWSEKDISETLLSDYLVNSLLRNEFQLAQNLDNFKRIVRGLSGIVTKRQVLDVRQEVIFLLGSGEIEFATGRKVSSQTLREKQSLDQTIADRWSTRSWKLSLDAQGDLIAESTSSIAARSAVKNLGGKVKSIKLAQDSTFGLAPVKEDDIFVPRPRLSMQPIPIEVGSSR